MTINGGDASVANRTFLSTNVPLAVGPNLIQAIGTDRVGPIYDAAHPGYLVIDVYPCGLGRSEMDFTWDAMAEFYGSLEDDPDAEDVADFPFSPDDF